MSDRELHDRLRSIGEHPVDPATRTAHLARLAAVDPVAAPRRRRFGPLAVASAGILGFLAGSTGLAMAGALPGDAQEVAHDVLGIVQLDVPDGKGGNRGSCVSEAAKIEDPVEKQAAKDACPKGKPEGDRGNRGSCVSEAAKIEDPVEKQAAKDACEQGGRADAPGRSGESNGKGQAKHADDPCKGKPPWAGPMSQDERDALKEEFSRDGCVDTDEADDTDTDTDDAETSDG